MFRDIAERGAGLVRVEYSNVQPSILSCQDAIKANSYHDVKMKDTDIGDAEVEIEAATVKVDGSFEMGAQQHYHTETMVRHEQF